MAFTIHYLFLLLSILPVCLSDYSFCRYNFFAPMFSGRIAGPLSKIGTRKTNGRNSVQVTSNYGTVKFETQRGCHQISSYISADRNVKLFFDPVVPLDDILSNFPGSLNVLEDLHMFFNKKPYEREFWDYLLTAINNRADNYTWLTTIELSHHLPYGWRRVAEKSNLKNLHLFYVSLENIILPYMSKLEILRIDHSVVRKFTLSQRQMPHIRELHLTNCGMKSTTFLRNINQLHVLNISGNNHMTLYPDDVESMAQIISLDISRTQLPTNLFNNEHFPNIIGLKKLYMNDCNLNKFEKRVSFKNLHFLKELYIRNNFLIHIPEMPDSVLTTLDASNNQISDIDTIDFRVQNLILSHNNISGWKSGSFLQNVDVLRLDNNNLTTITENMTRDLSNVNNIQMANNPIVCDLCALQYFLRWMRTHDKIEDLSDITCVWADKNDAIDNGPNYTYILNLPIQCRRPIWLIEILIPVAALMSASIVSCVFWLTFRKRILYLNEIRIMAEGTSMFRD